MPKQDTSAVAAWLGYKIQEYRLVERLIQADNNTIVGFELLDDVEEKSEGKLVLEQDKVTRTTRNIVSNSSKDLWKTLSNWIDLIKVGEVDPLTTTFLLYTNRQNAGDILKLLIEAKNEDDAKIACDSILSYVKKPSDSIKKYVENFASMDVRKYHLIVNFEYLYGSGSAPRDVEETYTQKRLGGITDPKEKEAVLNEILGWTSNQLTNAAEKKEPTLIRASSFGNRLGEIESKYRQQTLLQYLCSRNSSSSDVLSELTKEPSYIQQLKLVELDDIDVGDAAIAKLEAEDAICMWTIDGDIQESCYENYERSVERKWRNQKTKVFRSSKGLTDEDRGATLYAECLDSTESIKLSNKEVDPFFSQGTLQSLADKLTIGWHPHYQEKLEESNDT